MFCSFCNNLVTSHTENPLKREKLTDMNTTVENRLLALRQWMKRKGIHAFITPSTDPHSGEYVPERWKSREYISGFTGSAGTAVVTLTKAALWTDNRYFLQAAAQIEETDYTLMKIGLEDTPSIQEWLAEVLNEGEKVGVDGLCYTVSDFQSLSQSLSAFGIQTLSVEDPYDEVWEQRPQIPDNLVEIQPLQFAGETAKSKIARIRKAISAKKAESIVISMLDEVAWTLNLRGIDVECNPVFVSYLFISQNDATLYINQEKISAEVESYLTAEGVRIKNYSEIIADLKAVDVPVLIQADKTNYAIGASLQRPVYADCPVSLMKIMKNDAEIAGYHSAMLKDGIAMVKWMKWVIPAVQAGGQTELSLSEKLLGFRAEQPLFRGVSFESIMGYAAHGAIVHYEPTPETDIPVLPKGLLLIDSGGQYQDGTTDITRTIPLGELTEEERRDYTLVLRGWINLARAVFPRGTYGTQLDALAREPMWKYGINYLHGTGHGVGSYLNVHEGPHQFRMNYMPTPLLPGMTITDEPGIYITGAHGVRHENTMLVVEAKLRTLPSTSKKSESNEGLTFGPYYEFEQLTLCPILTSAIEVSMLQEEEKEWFNQYQQMVYDKLSPHLDEAHRTWLYEVTRPI